MSYIRVLKEKIKGVIPHYPALREWVRYQRMGNSPHYWDGTGLSSTPEICLTKLPIPDYIDTFLDLGCSTGRNMQPFEGKMRLWGIDIVPKERIRWVKPLENLYYEQLTVEQLTRRLEKHPIDMSKTLVFSSGTMMLVSRRYQHRFFDVCKRCGCRNFIFQDYEPGNVKHPFLHLKLPLDQFEVQSFRDHLGPHQTRAFYLLDHT